MDDLYINAWSDTQDSSTSKPKLPLDRSTSSWVSPKLPLPTVHDEEADLAAPSWSTGAGTQWNEPSEVSGFSWSQADSDLAWGASTYEGIDIKSPLPVDAPSQPVDDEAETVVGSAPQSLHLHAPEEISSPPSSALHAESSSSVLSPSLPIASLPDSSDAFGSFESAFISTAEDHSPHDFDSEEVGADAWGSAWANTDRDQAENKSAQVDEWEEAKKQKARQDRRVPPEVVASMLQQCNEFCIEVWPEGEKLSATGKDAWRNDWRSTLDGVEGLDSFLQSLLPPLTLQPAGQFGKSSIARKMANSVRLTKHLPLTKGSPMSHYLAARGSTAWEVAVKERKEAVEDDVPVGWRILEKQLSTSEAVDSTQAKKHGSRLFSFWSRRQSGASPARSTLSTTSPTDHAHPEGSESPFFDNTAHVRSPSHNSIGSAGRTSVDKVSSPVSATKSPTPSPLPLTPTVISPVSPPQMGSYSNAPEPPSEPPRTQSPPAAPSAVSRFFGRFSRHQSSHGSIGVHSSLALSPDDLEFLSDIPSANDESDHVPISSLASSVKPEPLPPVLPPPPLPPPPRVQSMGTNGSPVHELTSSTEPTTILPQIPDAQLNSLDSFFTSLDAGGSKPGSRASSVSLSATLQPTFPAGLVTPVPPSPLTASQLESRPLSPYPLSSSNSPIVEKQAATPFYLPSPPSSRAQTPSFPAPSTAPVHPTPELGRSSTVKPRLSWPRLPSPLRAHRSSTQPQANTSSLASTSSESPSTPSSARPLAELYPMAMRVNSLTNGTNATVVKASSSSSSSFILPPPPSSCSQAPATTAFTPTLPPPPRASSAASKPVSPFVNVLDDDDFSEFHSSPIPAPATLPLPQRAQSPSAIPAASSTRSNLSIASSSKQPPPPALSLSSLRSSIPLFDDNDNFSDFNSSVPASALPSSLQPTSSKSFDSPSSFSSFNTSTSEKAFLAPHKSAGFDVAGGLSPVLRSPSPPRPPSKSSTPSLILKPRGRSPDSPSHARKRSRAEEVQHTLELMERAAARPGRWPAPPSPLPTALHFPKPPPSASASSVQPLVDLMGDDGDDAPEPALAQPQPLAASAVPVIPAIPMSVSLSSPALFNPVRPSSGAGSTPFVPTRLSQSQSLQGWGAFEAVPRTGTPLGGGVPDLFSAPVHPSTSASAAQTAVKSSGLSAQDLSFFEGL
ncbi:hypothetical protein SCP_0902480 [Sparassis crispa]|uniref:Uncharacterized protein n=1 Tax=Sparassis crispa TaxID=139825 RepID=A0A401GW27_9APHY|nr:hypothetical protein SCP_0902480 [Sparassis crispa]GBE86369.1 hypothetical protein SCP_0902480 [Sparassis crispa]